MKQIVLNNVSKEYMIHEQQNSLRDIIKSLYKPSIRKVCAVSNLSFVIEEGEIVGLIGENGAGKSTTVKMMSGIIAPSSGEIRIKGISPYQNRKENAYNIGVIFGQRSRLMWDLPIYNSFRLYKEIYRIDDIQYKKRVEVFVEMLKMKDFLHTPTRQLSLGQRMKAELSLAILHNPSIMFLDEPTIGLDVLAKRSVRDFLIECNHEFGSTIVLTSHDMKDLDVVAQRLIMLDQGHLSFDGSIEKFKSIYGAKTIMTVNFKDNISDKIFCNNLFEVIENRGTKLILAYNDNKKISEILSVLEKIGKVVYFEIKPMDIEDIVREIYAGKDI